MDTDGWTDEPTEMSFNATLPPFLPTLHREMMLHAICARLNRTLKVPDLLLILRFCPCVLEILNSIEVNFARKTTA